MSKFYIDCKLSVHSGLLFQFFLILCATILGASILGEYCKFYMQLREFFPKFIIAMCYGYETIIVTKYKMQ